MPIPIRFPETYRSEIAKRFSAAQRAAVFAYLQTDIGQKMIRVLPDLSKATREAGDEWGRQTQKVIDRALRTGDDVS